MTESVFDGMLFCEKVYMQTMVIQIINKKSQKNENIYHLCACSSGTGFSDHCTCNC